MRLANFLGRLAVFLIPLASCGSLNLTVAVRPSFLVGAISSTNYDGVSDDLLTGGLGLTGLLAQAPAYRNPAAPSRSQLRRNAIHASFRQHLDTSPEGGFGILYGPNIDAAGANTLGEGKIAGSEHIAVADDGTGKKNVVMMVQIPASFDPQSPCIVAAASPGASGIYGAVSTAGDWGLKHRCALAYTDKGAGAGLHDVASDAAVLLDFSIGTASSAGIAAHFSTAMSTNERQSFNNTTPNRVALKQWHSQQNAQRDWGLHTLQSIKFALYMLNQTYGERSINNPSEHMIRYTAANTLVIASASDSGASAALAAAEQDTESLIDGIAVAQPLTPLAANSNFFIQQGSATVGAHSKHPADYLSYANLFQACAALSTAARLQMPAAQWPANFSAAAQQRCVSLRVAGLLSSNTLATQADEALTKLRDYGWLSEHDALHLSHYRLATPGQTLAALNALGRFAVTEQLCGFSLAHTDSFGAVIPQSTLTQASFFASSDGQAPGPGIDIVYTDALAASLIHFLAVSSSSGRADLAFDGALCLRSMVTGVQSNGSALSGNQKANSDRVRAGMTEVLLSAKVQYKPTIIVAGRSDAMHPVNHAARAYYGRNLLAETGVSKTRYYEITHAQHQDAWLAAASQLGYENRFVPLHVYYVRAMDLMWSHLKQAAVLPQSQVVRSTPRALGVNLSATNVPGIVASPAASEQISLSLGTLRVPD